MVAALGAALAAVFLGATLRATEAVLLPPDDLPIGALLIFVAGLLVAVAFLPAVAALVAEPLPAAFLAGVAVFLLAAVEAELFLLAEAVAFLAGAAAFLAVAALELVADLAAVAVFLLAVLAAAFLGAALFLVVAEEAVLFLLLAAVVPAVFLGAALFFAEEALVLAAFFAGAAAFLLEEEAFEELPAALLAPPVVEAAFLVACAINCEFRG